MRLTHCFIDVALQCRIFRITSLELADDIGLVQVIIDNVDDSLNKKKFNLRLRERTAY